MDFDKAKHPKAQARRETKIYMSQASFDLLKSKSVETGWDMSHIVDVLIRESLGSKPERRYGLGAPQ